MTKTFVNKNLVGGVFEGEVDTPMHTMATITKRKFIPKTRKNFPKQCIILSLVILVGL